jgi:hypothetical protein
MLRTAHAGVTHQELWPDQNALGTRLALLIYNVENEFSGFLSHCDTGNFYR